MAAAALASARCCHLVGSGTGNAVSTTRQIAAVAAEAGDHGGVVASTYKNKVRESREKKFNKREIF